jgi:hypothetical protein
MNTPFAMILSLFSFFSLNAFAGHTLESCKVSKMVNENILDESFSLEEYPEVSVEEDLGQLTLTIGMNVFDNFTDSYSVRLSTTLPVSWAFGYEAVSEKTGESFSIAGRMVVNSAGHLAKIGTVQYKNLITGNTEVLAEITCDL